MRRRPQDLHQRIKDLQRKTEGNRKVAADARDAADAALGKVADVEEVSVAQVCVSGTNSRQLLRLFLPFRR